MADDVFDRILDTFLEWFGAPPSPAGYVARPMPPGYEKNPPQGGTGVTPTHASVEVPRMMITIEQLQKIYTRMNAPKGQLLLPYLNQALVEFKIDTPARAAAFVAQVGHETYQLRYTEEVWGPTEAQKNYEPPSHLATVLGNTEKGDGFRYRGRGAFQCTGRTNYRRYGHALGIDLEGHPELAGEPTNTFRIAGVYWNDHGLSTLADAGNFREITRRINGGYNGEAEREAYWNVAKQVLGVV